jgi:hypothetical protein
MLGASVHTGIPLEPAHAGAQKLDASLATVVVAAYYHAVRTVLGRPAVLLMAISANRFDPSMAGVVTSLTQWAPMLLDFDGTEPFAELAAKVHGKALNAGWPSRCRTALWAEGGGGRPTSCTRRCPSTAPRPRSGWPGCRSWSPNGCSAPWS